MLWRSVSFDQLSVYELYELMRLRVDVFVVEQQCAYPELDGKDCHQDTRHLLGTDDEGHIVAYARILPPGLSYQQASIGRVVVNADYRKFGAGAQLMQQAISLCKQCWPDDDVRIGAQQYLLKFYQSLGFVPVSEMYLEDGIPHVDMQLQ